jgi:hypothetical protein
LTGIGGPRPGEPDHAVRPVRNDVISVLGEPVVSVQDAVSVSQS